tara:strand:+ start:1063 stop:1266 length:204 start_codon:yes stop_codon:yes gene_type:complete
MELLVLNMVIATIAKMEDSMESLKADFYKFEKGNDSAGRRMRKTCSELSKACKEIRVDVQSVRSRRK